MNNDKYNPDAIREAFTFLVSEFRYSIIRDEELLHDNRRYAFVIEYVGNERRVHLTHDYKENFFYFMIIRGTNTRFPNGNDHDNIVSFWRLFSHFEPLLELNTIQPDSQTCAQAATMNAQLLIKYGTKILLGDEWI